MSTPTGDLDGGTPESPDAPSVPTDEEFREFVGAGSVTSDLQRDLQRGIEAVDDFCRDPQRPIPDTTLKGFYLLVAAEIFDASQGPSTTTDPFGNARQARSTRDPLQVIMRQARRYVSAF